jgi:hypothetical protein
MCAHFIVALLSYFLSSICVYLQKKSQKISMLTLRNLIFVAVAMMSCLVDANGDAQQQQKMISIEMTNVELTLHDTDSASTQANIYK